VFACEVLADEKRWRLRMWYGTLPPFKPDGPFPPYTLLYAESDDGLHWRPYDGNPVMPMRHDCNLNLLYDPSRRIWTAYCRPCAWASGRWLPGDHPRRRIAVTQSPDLIQWSKLRTAIAPQEGDSNEFDHISVFPCGNRLVGLQGIFQVMDDDPHRQHLHVEPAFSVDGYQWERVPGRQHFLSPGDVAAWPERPFRLAWQAGLRAAQAARCKHLVLCGAGVVS